MAMSPKQSAEAANSKRATMRRRDWAAVKAIMPFILPGMATASEKEDLPET
jgi:hypothetical protein